MSDTQQRIDQLVKGSGLNWDNPSQHFLAAYGLEQEFFHE
jgi:hypothetical protein